MNGAISTIYRPSMCPSVQWRLSCFRVPHASHPSLFSEGTVGRADRDYLNSRYVGRGGIITLLASGDDVRTDIYHVVHSFPSVSKTPEQHEMAARL